MSRQMSECMACRGTCQDHCKCKCHNGEGVSEFEKAFEDELLLTIKECRHGQWSSAKWAAQWAFKKAAEIAKSVGRCEAICHCSEECADLILHQSERLRGKQALEQDGK